MASLSYASVIDHFVKNILDLLTFLSNCLVTLLITVRLLLDPRQALHIQHEEAHRIWAHPDVVCVYTRRGRVFLVKNGRYNSKIVGNKKGVRKIDMRHRKGGTHMLFKTIGSAATNSGDHEIRWKLAKPILRTAMRCPSSSVAPLLESVLPAVSKALMRAMTDNDEVPLYNTMLRESLEAAFFSMCGAPLSRYLPDQAKRMAFLDKIDTVAQAAVEGISPVHNGFYEEFMNVSKSACEIAPKGTFGWGLKHMKDDCPELDDEVAMANFCFYWSAVPTVGCALIRNFVLTMHRNPEHIQQCLDDKSHFRRCLKECIRLFPPVVRYAPRKTKEDIQLGTVDVPKSSLILILPSLQVGTTEFRPDRWVGNESLSADFFDKDVVYSPFSTGSRACLMKSYATDMFESLVEGVLSTFTFELVDKDVLNGKSPSHQVRSDVLIANRPAVDYRFRVNLRNKTTV